MISILSSSHYLHAVDEGASLPNLDAILKPLCREPFRRIDRFMTAASGPALLALLKRAIDGRSRETGQAQTKGVGAASKSLRVVARGHSDGRSCLLILIDAGEWSH